MVNILLCFFIVGVSSVDAAQQKRPQRAKPKPALEKPAPEKPQQPAAAIETIESLAIKFGNENENDRFDAITKIVDSKSPYAGGYVMRGVKDSHWLVRGRAMQLVANLPPSERAQALPILREAASDEYWFVRASALQAMADIFQSREASERDFARSSFDLVSEMRLDSEPPVRRQAARALSKIGDDRAVAFIAPLLTDEDERVRWEAALALAALGDRRAVEPLSGARERLGKDARPISVALYQFGDKDSFAELVKSIDEVDAALRRRLILMLCRSADPRSLEPLAALLKSSDGDPELQSIVISSLGKLHDARATDALAVYLKNDDRDLQFASIAALSESQDQKAVPLLAERLLAARDREMGETLIKAIASFKRHETVDYLFTVRKDLQGNNRPVIELALTEMGVTIDKLTLAVKKGFSPPWQGPQAATRWLAALGTGSTVEPLVSALDNREPKVRSEAARALGNFGDRRAIEPLLLLLDDPFAEVRAASSEALTKLGIDGGSLSERLKSADWRARADAANIVGRMGLADLVPALISTSRDTEAAVRYESITALGRLKDNRAVECLVVALDDESGRVRSASAAGLGKIGDVQAASALIRTLGSYDIALGALAADALLKLRRPETVAGLITTLKSRNWRARAQAARVLGEWAEPSAVLPLVDLLHDKTAPVRYYARQSLGRMGEQAVQPLTAALRKDEFNNYGPAQALIDIGPPAVEALCALMSESTGQMRITAATVLAEIGDPRAVEPMVAALEDDRFMNRLGIAQALGKMGDAAFDPLLEALSAKKLPKKRAGAAIALKYLGRREAAPALLVALNDKDDQVRASAAEALAAVGDIGAISLLEQMEKSDRADSVRTAARVAIHQIQIRNK